MRHTSLARHGTPEQLRKVPARLQAQRLDHSRPLWEFNGGLGVAIFGHDGEPCWGLNADFDLVPDLPRFSEALRESFAALSKAAARHASPLTSVQAS